MPTATKESPSEGTQHWQWLFENSLQQFPSLLHLALLGTVFFLSKLLPKNLPESPFCSTFLLDGVTCPVLFSSDLPSSKKFSNRHEPNSNEPDSCHVSTGNCRCNGCNLGPLPKKKDPQLKRSQRVYPENGSWKWVSAYFSELLLLVLGRVKPVHESCGSQIPSSNMDQGFFMVLDFSKHIPASFDPHRPLWENPEM